MLRACAETELGGHMGRDGGLFSPGPELNTKTTKRSGAFAYTHATARAAALPRAPLRCRARRCAAARAAALPRAPLRCRARLCATARAAALPRAPLRSRARRCATARAAAL